MMLQPPPPRPVGSDYEARFMQWVWDSLVRFRLVPGRGTTIQHTTQGVIIEAKPTGAYGSGGACQMFQVQGHSGDYLTCKTWDGTSAGSEVSVAVPWTLRVDKKPSDAHAIWPGFTSGDIILADSVANSGVIQAPNWVAQPAGRFWALSLDVCTDAGVKQAWFHCSNPES